MYNLIQTLVIALAACAPAVEAVLPVTDPVLGVTQQRPFCPARPASAEFQRSAFYEMVNEFYFEDGMRVQSLKDFMSPDYIQHNPYELSGLNNSIATLGHVLDNATFTVLHVMFDSPIGALHYKVQFPDQPPIAFTDIWRYNGTCIEEHWDVIQSLPANATNPIALF